MARKGSEPAISERSYRLADGTQSRTYSVRYFDGSGVRRRLSCASREEADFERARIVLEQTRGVVSETTAPAPPPELEPALRVGEFWPTWLGDARSRLTRTTLQQYERIFRALVAPRFAAVAMDGVRPRMVSQWRAELLDAGVGVESIRRAMVLLQAMFTVAIEWGEASANPVSVVRKPRQGRRRAVVPLAPEAVELLRAELLRRGSPLSAALVSVLAYAGLRPGEALALEVRHVRDQTILVEQALSDGELKVQKTGRQYRTVDLLGILGDELRESMDATGALDPEALVFPRADGGVWRGDCWNNWRNRHFHPAAAAAGLGRPRPYDLRHSFASLLIREQRTSIVELAEQLGHAPTMTLNTYAHVFAEHRRQQPVDVEEWVARAREAALNLDGGADLAAESNQIHHHVPMARSGNGQRHRRLLRQAPVAASFLTALVLGVVSAVEQPNVGRVALHLDVSRSPFRLAAQVVNGEWKLHRQPSSTAAGRCAARRV